MRNRKYLGIDWGEKRIGLALGDSETKLASPFKVVGSIEEIVKAIEEEEVDEIIIGAPLKMLSSKLRMSNEFLDFFELLKNKVSIPIKKIDERLSSKAADALAGDKKTKASRDALAAMIILQTYLDSF